MTKYYRASIIAAILAFQVACATPNAIQLSNSIPPAWVNWQPADSVACSGPCWQGLVVGKSREKDVLEVLQRLTFIYQPIQRGQWTCCVPGAENDMQPGTVLFANCKQPADLCLQVGLSNGIFTGFELTLNSQVSMGDAIKTLGDPDLVGYQLQGAETLICDINVVWTSRQLVLISRSYSDKSPGMENCDLFRSSAKIKQTLLISEVHYRTAASLAFLFSREPSEYLRFKESMLDQ